MLLVVDPQSGVPVYRQLMDQIRFHIASGLARAGVELPSTRALSTELGVNPMTISKVYSLLEREGLIERRPGRPLVVRAQSDDQARERRAERIRESLAPTATMARQLGIPPEEALRIFGELLAEGASEDDARDASRDSAEGEQSER